MTGAITLLLLCQLAGEVAVRALHLPIPGPVIGLVLLFAGLLARGGTSGEAPAALAAVGDTLLGNLGLLFVPAGVGVVLYGPLLARDWVPIALTVFVGTGVAIAGTGLLAQLLLRR